MSYGFTSHDSQVELIVNFYTEGVPTIEAAIQASEDAIADCQSSLLEGETSETDLGGLKVLSRNLACLQQGVSEMKGSL